MKKIDASPVRCPDEEAAADMMALIDKAHREGDSLGGRFEVVVAGCQQDLATTFSGTDGLMACFRSPLWEFRLLKGLK